MTSSPDEPPAGPTDDPGRVDLETLDPSEYRTRSGSFSSSALPHAHVPADVGGLDWEIESCETDRGEEVPLEPSTNTASLIGMDWDTVSLKARVTYPEWCHRIVAPDAVDWTGRLGLAYWCRRTILRNRSDTVSLDEPGTHLVSVKIDRERVREKVQLQPALVLAERGDDSEDAYARYPGHRMAEGEVWTLKTDLRRSIKNLLHPETKKFSDDPDFPDEDHLTFLDLDRDPPALYINADHDRIIAALDSDAYQGWDAAVREVAYDLIEAEVWPQLLFAAAADIGEDEGPDQPWKQGVIEKFREPIYGADTSYEEAVDELRHDLESPQRLARLIHDLDHAVQSRSAPPSDYQSLLDMVDNR